MNYTLVNISTFSIAIPAIIGLLRIKKIEPGFYPFLILIWIGFINEMLNFLLLRAGYSNTVNSNVYSLAESLLIILFFKKTGLFEKSTMFFYLTGALFILMWIVDTFFISAQKFDSYFTAATSFVYVLMSITMINRLLAEQIKTLIKHPVFVISMGFILFFTCALIVAIFWIYGLDSSMEFLLQVYLIKTYINIVVNLIYALAILWIPEKREYILQ